MTEQPFGGPGETPPPVTRPPVTRRPVTRRPTSRLSPASSQARTPGPVPPAADTPIARRIAASSTGFDPAAPFGRHPLTGEPFSDKSKVVAGLLQLLGLVGVVGIGRIYLGYTTLGITQLIGGVVLGIVTCGIGFIVPVIWGIIDATLILTDKVRDPAGRPLRDAI